MGTEGALIQRGFRPGWYKWTKDITVLMNPYLPFFDIIGTNPRMRTLKTGFRVDPRFLDFVKDRPDITTKFGLDKIIDSVQWTSVDESIDVGTLPYIPAAMNLPAAYIGLSKYCRTYGQNDKVDQVLWGVAKSWMFNEFLPLIANSQIYDLQTVMDHSDLSRSPGPCFVGRWKTKQDMLLDPDGREIVNSYWEECRFLGNSFTLFGCNEKDELRPFDKVEANKTRLFWASSITHHINGARLMLNAIEKLRDRRKMTCHTIGMSRFGREWHDRLCQFLGRFVGDFDGRTWDALYPDVDLWDQCELYWEALSPEYRNDDNRNRLINYFGEGIYSYGIMPDGVVIQVRGGMKSGKIITAPSNTMQHFRQHCYVWLKLVDSSNTTANFRRFRATYLLCILGDDALFSPPDIPVLTFVNIKGQLDLFLEHTSSHNRFVSIINEAIYCSQRSIMLRGRILPVPDAFRCISSLLIGGKRLDADISASRCCMIRVHAYWDNEVRQICEDYYDFLIKKYLQFADDETWLNVKSQFLTSAQIFKLYTGYELQNYSSLGKAQTVEKDMSLANVAPNLGLQTINKRGKKKKNNRGNRGVGGKEGQNLRQISKEIVSPQVKVSREIQSVVDHKASAAGYNGAGGGKDRRRRSGLPPAVYKAARNRNQITRTQTLDDLTPGYKGSRRQRMGAYNGYTRRDLIGSIFLPEKYGAQQWPDAYAEATSPFQVIMQDVLPITQNAYGPNFPQYTSSIVAMPTFTEPLQIFTEITLTVDAIMEVSLTKMAADGLFGLTKRNLDVDDYTNVLDSMVIDFNGRNITAFMTQTQTDPSYKIYPMKNTDPSGLYFFGYSIDLSVAGSGVGFNVITDAANAVVNGLTLYVITTTSVTPVNFNLNLGTSSTTIPAPLLQDYRGDKMVGFALGLNSAAVSPPNFLNVTSCRLQMTLKNGSTQLFWVPANFPGYSQANTIYNKYRVTGMSLWLQCISSQSFTGGEVAMRLQRGRPWTYDGSSQYAYQWNFKGLSSSYGSYSGKYLDGCYGCYLGEDSSDYDFKSTGHSFYGGMPHIVANTQLIPVGGTTTGLRYRLVINYECLTSLTIIPCIPSPDDPQALDILKRLVEGGHIPMVTANDWHDFLMDIANGFGKGLDVVEKYSEVTQRAITVLGPIFKVLGMAMV